MQLKPIDRTDKGVSRLNAALSIYRATILQEAQNPEVQIRYWIDHSRETLTDEFKCFALVDKGEVCGYLQYSYFGEEHIFFFEYLCIAARRTRGLIPSTAVESIRDYLLENYHPNFTIVFEIAQRRDTSGQWKPDKKLINYFKRLGFRTVDFEYHYPVLQSFEGEDKTSYPADLMVGFVDKTASIDASKMRAILRCIYFKHYLRWDRPFLDPERFSKREKLIDELYSREVARIGGSKRFETRGDDRRSLMDRLETFRPRIGSLLETIFAPKLPRFLAIMLILLGVQHVLGNVFWLIPFVLLAAAVHCLIEDTKNSRKLFQVIVAKLSVTRLR